MTRTGFEKFLKEINSNLCLTTDCQLRPVEILFADDANNVAKTVFDLITGTWHEGDNYLSLNEHDELNNLLIGSGAFLKGTHLFEESDFKKIETASINLSFLRLFEGKEHENESIRHQ